MTSTIEKMLDQLKDKRYRQYRIHSQSTPILYPLDFFGFHMGTAERLPQDDGGNLTPNYQKAITLGFDAIRRELVASIAAATDAERIAYGQSMLDSLDRCLAICDAFRNTVRDSGNHRLLAALERVPHLGAESFYEACVFLNLCVYFLRTNKVGHIGLGRFDQYMYPFYLQDKARGVSDEEIFELIEALFLSLNYDNDLYWGLQQGDNGQSMVLGGFDRNGNSQYNALTDMCLEASLELTLIDPKINLRVGKNTPEDIFLRATRLTKQGLGFPQYCNDDVVIPGLVKLGYDMEDAENYVVAACWEYIIPGCGADMPNIKTMNFPLVINRVIHEKLPQCASFEALMDYVEQGIAAECDALIEAASHRTRKQQPFLSLFIDGCIDQLRDLWDGGAKYHNFGCHGAGIANATDALTAIKVCVFDKKTLRPEELLQALDADFEGFSDLRNTLRSCPKMGNNESNADDIACRIMGYFCDHMNGRDNRCGGIWRAGTGSAMEYIKSAAKCPATADGRLAFTPYASSYSPSLDTRVNGLLSVMQSFTKFDMTRIINGGPLTLEIHDSVLRNEIGIVKTAQLIQTYIRMGGHQLQLNSVNRERLLDAQKHPEKYPNLIVRVWGWSGYFNELDLPYQNHIIRRCEFMQ